MPAPGEMPQSDNYDVAKKIIDGDSEVERKMPVPTPQDIGKYRSLENLEPSQGLEQTQGIEPPESMSEKPKRLSAIIEEQSETIKELQAENVELIQHQSETDDLLKSLVIQLIDSGIIGSFMVSEKDIPKLKAKGYPVEQLHIVD